MRNVSPRRELFQHILPQILRWLDEGHTRVAIRAHLATGGLRIPRATFDRYLIEAQTAVTPGEAQDASPPKPRRQPKQRTTPPKPQAKALKSNTPTPAEPPQAAVSQPPEHSPQRVTLDMLKAPDGSPRKLLSSFTPPPPIPLDEL